MEKLKHYEGLYGDLNFKRHKDYIFLEKIETRSIGFGWVIDSHIHSHLYQFFFIQNGIVELRCKMGLQKLNAPCVLIIPPSTLHGLRYSADVKGHILTLSDTVVENICKDTPSILVNFENFHLVSFENQKDRRHNSIMAIMAIINDELFASRAEKNTFLNASFIQLFISLLRSFQNNETMGSEDVNASLKYFRKFQLLIKKTESFSTIPTYASELGISHVHLNRVCKHVSGKSALVHIEEHKIEQAKNYLTHTSYTVSEIAYLLNFEYPNYFAKLFKKITGITPSEFRNEKKG